MSNQHKSSERQKNSNLDTRVMTNVLFNVANLAIGAAIAVLRKVDIPYKDIELLDTLTEDAVPVDNFYSLSQSNVIQQLVWLKRAKPVFIVLTTLFALFVTHQFISPLAQWIQSQYPMLSSPTIQFMSTVGSVGLLLCMIVFVNRLWATIYDNRYQRLINHSFEQNKAYFAELTTKLSRASHE